MNFGIDFRCIDDFLMNALKEDIAHGDITTMSTIDENTVISGAYIAKESGVICGLDVAKRVFELLGGNVEFNSLKKDGEKIEKGEIIAEISGNARIILMGERVGLNLMQHLSGIATRTAYFVEKIKGTNAKIVDTRKTTPNMRVLEKYAVRVGGGTNHRFNLADGVLIKDNHIVAAGGIKNAVEQAKKITPHTIKIEVEASNFDEVQQALDAKADIIMLDNMSIEDMQRAVEIIDGRALVEASGNMDKKDILAVAKTGVDLISFGALTHSVTALDISLKFKTRL